MSAFKIYRYETKDDLTKKDKESLLKIYINNYQVGLTKSYVNNLTQLEQKLSNKSKLIISKEKNKIIGFVSLSEPDVISLIEVHPDYQKKGMGTQLIRYLQKHYPSLKAIIDAEKPEGIRILLTKCGFNQHKNIWMWEG